MKNLIKISILLLFTANNFAQTIVNIEELSLEVSPDTYYKDINNFFEVFVGTWIYTDGTTSFKLVLEKKAMVPNNVNNSFFDYLIGEYQYIKNGNELINTIGNTDANNLGILGNLLLKNTYRPYCSDCPEDERRIGLSLKKEEPKEVEEKKEEVSLDMLKPGEDMVDLGGIMDSAFETANDEASAENVEIQDAKKESE